MRGNSGVSTFHHSTFLVFASLDFVITTSDSFGKTAYKMRKSLLFFALTRLEAVQGAPQSSRPWFDWEHTNFL